MRQKFRNINSITAPSVKTYALATAMVLIACLTITLWSWNNAKQNLKNDLQATLNIGTKSVQDTVTTTLGTYSEVLKGGAGLISTLPDVTQDSWQRYFQNLDIVNRYPGLQDVAYDQIIPASELDNFLDTNPSPAGGRYNIQPSTPRDTYVITRFTEPLDDNTAKTLGYDPFTEPVRQRAMVSARDTGQATITPRVVLKRDDNSPQPGFVIYVPVYKRDVSVNNATERRAALQGYVSAGVRTKELIDQLFAKAITKDSALVIYDGTTKSDQNIIYASTTYKNLINQSDLTKSEVVLDAVTTKWTIVAYTNKSLASAAQRKQPQAILIGGVTFSILVSAFLFILMTTRARALANEKSQEVQEAKDSLISLASHQLRTPATGVKQFVGMVLEGYVGKITKSQKQLLEKAYQSNERQLEIINQILHVTRADSGRLVLHKEKLDINQLIKTIISEQQQSIKARNQKVIFKKGSPTLQITADRQYLTMAIDNLLSNASKYSHPNQTIRIATEPVGRNIVIKVADRGVGIDAQDMHKLFQKFSRIDNELSIEAGGNGIGLYLCREVVALHNGTIEVESRAGQGSSFIITLPKR